MFGNQFIFNIKCLPLWITIEHTVFFFYCGMLNKLLLSLKSAMIFNPCNIKTVIQFKLKNYLANIKSEKTPKYPNW